MKVLPKIGFIVAGCGFIYAAVKIHPLPTLVSVLIAFIGCALIISGVISLTFRK